MESRDSYGWGYVGSSKKGFEWLVIYGDRPSQRVVSGYVFNTEEQALRAGKAFQRKNKFDDIRNGNLQVINARPLHFEY